ncbi:MAG: endoribonuclease MazF [Nitrospinota bacterium]
MVEAYVPGRGDVIWLDLDPRSGHEQAGHRPALVISPQPYNQKTSLALCCPITRQVKGYPFEVKLPDGLPVSGVVLSDHVRNLDWQARSARFECKVPEHVVDEVRGKLALLIH